MNSKNHRQNHDFQILYFLVGSCSTPDGAYSLLQDLKEEREMALEHYAASQIRAKATLIKIKKLLNSSNEEDVLEGQALELETSNSQKRGEVLYQAAVDELNFINKCIDQIEPLRKYKHLPIAEANEATQMEEWKGELIRRAENFMLTTGYIPTDEFNTMRMHPLFKQEILPSINQMFILSKSNEGMAALQERICENREYMQKILALPENTDHENTN